MLRGIKGAGAPDDAVDLVALGEKQVSQVRAVLTCNSRNKRLFHLRYFKDRQRKNGKL